eukprot:6178976-Pleurochrysis_carterae.AAC.5
MRCDGKRRLRFVCDATGAMARATQRATAARSRAPRKQPLRDGTYLAMESGKYPTQTRTSVSHDAPGFVHFDHLYFVP